MRPYYVFMAVIAGGLLVTAACSTAPRARTSSGPALPPPVSTSPTAAAKPVVNERGNIVKKLGEEGGWGEGRAATSFTVDKVIVDPNCKYPTGPSSGHTILVEVRVATGAEQSNLASSILNSANFAEIGTDGVTRPAEFGSCTDARRLPQSYGANQKYQGAIELVVPEADGSLVLNAQSSTSAGWEWRY